MTTKTIESIVARYNELQPVGLSKLTPRKGYYYIKEVFSDSRFVEFYKAKALWKEHKEDSFISEAEFTIQLTSLHEDSGNLKTFHAHDLIDKTVVIYNTVETEFTYKSVKYPHVRCFWAVVETPMTIETTEAASMNLLLKKFNGSIGEFVQHINSSLNETTLASIEDEENRRIDEGLLVENPNEVPGDNDNEDGKIDPVATN